MASCPVFHQSTEISCPFHALSDTSGTKDCPAFDSGCPFATETISVNALASAFAAVPASHAKHGEFSQAISAVHRVLAASGDKKCPVLSQAAGTGGGCPFTAQLPHLAALSVELESRLFPHSAGEAHLASELKEGTSVAHKAAENVLFVQKLLKGEAPLALYFSHFVPALVHVYQALEEAAARWAVVAPATIGAIHDPTTLERVPSLLADLREYYTSEAEVQSNLTRAKSDPVVVAYVDKIKRADGDTLIAHLYARYLGDLSGGTMIRRALLRHYGENTPVSFYDFAALPKPTDKKKYKDKYRAALDALSMSSDRVRDVVAEANVVFAANARLFRSLDVAGGWTSEEEAAKADEEMVATIFGPTPPPNAVAKGKGQCPFAALASTVGTGKAAKSQARLNMPMATAIAVVVLSWIMWFTLSKGAA
mmetsp:Transcript_7175/g.22963  ORF Transcript_7175/g.22963 Transcript_7175/m.22963 type:complete len:424 (-) Transcript_7175:52-1323(-)